MKNYGDLNVKRGDEIKVSILEMMVDVTSDASKNDRAIQATARYRPANFNAEYRITITVEAGGSGETALGVDEFVSELNTFLSGPVNSSSYQNKVIHTASGTTRRCTVTVTPYKPGMMG